MGKFISAHNKFFNNRQHPGYWANAAGGNVGSVWIEASEGYALNGSDPAWANADFNPAQNLVKQAEGGYSNDPRDPGNYTGGKVGVGALIGTNWGISAPVLAAELKRLGGAVPTAAIMKNLSYDNAVGIYKRNYWAPIKGDAIKDQRLANAIYDTAVNMGVGRAQQYVNDSLNTTKYDVAKINAANPKKVFEDVIASRKKFYVARGGYALNSWLDRLKKLGGDLEKNKGKTVLVVLGLSALIGGAIYYHKNK